MNYQINCEIIMMYIGIQNRNKKLYIVTCGIATENR